MIEAINIALTGLKAASTRVQASASNIANISTVGALDEADGPAPFSALTTTQKAVTNGSGGGQGVQASIVEKDPGFVPAFSPDSPFVNEDGIIGVPNVNLSEEAVNLKLAEASYQSSIAVLKTANEMSEELLGIFDDRV